MGASCPCLSYGDEECALTVEKNNLIHYHKNISVHSPVTLAP
jgi:hypothetical protein